LTAPDIPFSQKAQRTGEQPVSRLMAEALANPTLISLAAGFVDHASLPTEQAARALADLLAHPDSAKAALQYGTTRGYPPLREALLGRFECLEGAPAQTLALTVDNVVVTTGSQQGLYLLADVLLDPGDIVITSAPSYFVYTGALQSFGAEIRSVEMDQGGMRMDRLEGLLKSLQATGHLNRVKLIYLVSYYQNPTGLSLAPDRRQRLLELVRTYSQSHRIVIIEDAAYRELRYDGPAYPSVKSFDPKNQYVVHAMTFSKAFSPGMKIGAVFLPDDLLDAVLRQKGNHDFGSANLIQHALSRIMETGIYAEHVAQLRQRYKAKRDAMLAALADRMADLPLTWTAPAGGLYAWLTAPNALDTSRGKPLFQRCIDSGVLYVPGDYCFAPQADNPVPTNHMRLSFGAVGIPAIHEGVSRLAQAIRNQLDQGHASAIASTETS